MGLLRVPKGIRPTVAKFLDIVDTIDDSDIIDQYVREIAGFYSSEYKTKAEILIQHEADIKALVNAYNYACIRFYGYEPKTALELVFQPKIDPDKRFKRVIYNIELALEFLLNVAAKLNCFLSIEKLEGLGLKNVKKPFPIIVYDTKDVPEGYNTIEEWLREYRRINPKDKVKVKRKIESVYDSAIGFYQTNGYIIDYPEIPQEMQRVFNNDKKLYWDICNQCKGKDLKGVAKVYANADTLNKDNTMRPFLRHFVTRLIDPNMSKEEETKYYQQFRRALGLK